MSVRRCLRADGSLLEKADSFRMILKATEEQVRDALLQVTQTTSRWNLSEDDASSIEIVLAEALNNVVEHAYAGIPDGIITLDCSFNGNGFSIVITDQGHPVPESVFLSKHSRLQNFETSDLPEGGFGWGLIKELSHDLKVSRIGKTTLLSLTINTA